MQITNCVSWQPKYRASSVRHSYSVNSVLEHLQRQTRIINVTPTNCSCAALCAITQSWFVIWVWYISSNVMLILTHKLIIKTF